MSGDAEAAAEKAAAPQETRRVSFVAEISPLTVSAGDSFIVTVTIKNHDKKPVEGVRIVVRGPWDSMQDKFVSSTNITHEQGLLSGPNLRVNSPIGPGETVVGTVKLFTKTPGVHEFKVSLAGGKGPGLRDETGAALEPLVGSVRVRSI